MTTGPTRRGTRRTALALGGLAVAEVAVAVGLAVGVGLSFADALASFVVTNALMGVTFALCGAILAWHRPRNVIGWLFVADALGHATTALGGPLLVLLHDTHAPLGLQRLVATVATFAWPWSIGLFLPLALLLFPDGRPLSPRWRPVIFAVVLTAPVFVLSLGSSPEPLVARAPVTGHLAGSAHPLLSVAAEVRNTALLALALATLMMRYRRAEEVQRRQLLWLLLATIAMFGFTLPWSYVAGTPVVVLFTIPMIPVAVTIAIVRHRLLDIRLVVSRAVSWVLLSLGVVLAYGGLVAVLDQFVSAQFGRSAVVTVIVALLVAPLLPRLQRLVDRAMYGDRGDPARVVSRVSHQMATDSGTGLEGVAIAVRDALRVPMVRVSADGDVLAATGEAGPDQGVVALTYGGASVGELAVGLRPGEQELSTADRLVLELVALPLAVAVHAMRLSDELQASRQRIVSAQEEERRRLRRDLHDGLGPTLTGVALTADAAANLVATDAIRAGELLAMVAADTRGAIADVRRLIEDLRPSALDALGLFGALRQRAEDVRWRADGEAIRVCVDLPDGAPAVPAAIEVACYRIVAEALNNVVRHSRASTAMMRVGVGDALVVEVTDDGPVDSVWIPGVGLRAMSERAAELGGHLEAGPSPAGGRVAVTFPLAPT